MLSVSLIKVRRSHLRISRATPRQAVMNPVREGTTPPLSSGLSTLRIFVATASKRLHRVGSRLKMLAHLRPLSPLISSYQRKEVCKGAKCSAFHRHQVVIDNSRGEGQCCAWSLAERAAKLRVGPAPYIGSPAELASPCPAPFLQGTATPCLSLPAIPPGTCTPSPCARSSRAFRIAAARSGPLVQRVRDTLHRFARINVAAVHLDTKAGASERNTIVPRSTVRATLAVGPSRALEAVSPPHKLSVLVGVWETSGSQTPTKTVSPSAQDRLQRQRSTAFRALWHRKIHRRLPPVLHQYAIVITRCDQPPAILPAP